MHRIDAPGHLANTWTQGDPVTGVEPTEVSADFMNAVQEELANVIEGTGASLNKADNSQLFGAITAGLINPWANRLLNTQFEFWQRFGDDPWTGTPVNHDADVDALELVGPDRWFVNSGDVLGDADFTREEFALGTVPIGMEAQGQPTYYLRWLQSVVSTALRPQIAQRIEGVRTFAGQKISVSFMARVTSGTESASVGTIQHFGTTGSPSSSVDELLAAHTVTTTWTRFTSTVTLASMSGKTIGTDENDHLEISIRREVATTGTMEITDVRISPGIATNNTILLPSWIDFLGCLRYYWKTYDRDGVPGTTASVGVRFGLSPMVDDFSSKAFGSNIRFPVEMRVAPTLGPALLTRTTGDTGGLQRVWNTGPATLGDIQWAGAQTVTGEFGGRFNGFHLLVADTDLTSAAEVWRFHADFDAEIWIKA